MTSEHLTVAIDGPSGSGKSSVSKAVARELGVGFLDTGAMYRALTWWCLEEGVDLDDQAAVAQAARELPLEMGTTPGCPRSASRAARSARTSARHGSPRSSPRWRPTPTCGPSSSSASAS